MELKKPLILLSSLLVLSACAKSNPPETIVQTEYIERTIEQAQRPSPINLMDVKWYVVNEGNIDEFLSRFEGEEGEIVFIALSVRDYENLSLNLAELRRYIAQQKQIIVYYETAIK
jgi:hypothetical protein